MRFYSIDRGETSVRLEGDNIAYTIPSDKFVAVDDESGDIAIKTVGSRATIGLISADAYYGY